MSKPSTVLVLFGGAQGFRWGSQLREAWGLAWVLAWVLIWVLAWVWGWIRFRFGPGAWGALKAGGKVRLGWELGWVRVRVRVNPNPRLGLELG